MSRRVLILEFVTHERWVFDSRLLPFVKGAADSLGASSEWRCYGVQIRTEKTGFSSIVQFVDLEGDELAALEARLREMRPTHILVTHRIATGLRDRILAIVPEVSFLSVSDHAGPDGVPNVRGDEFAEQAPAPARGVIPPPPDHWVISRTDWILDWLGETPLSHPDFDKYVVGTIVPSYDAVMANDAALRYQPHLLMIGGVTCDHKAKVTKNLHYKDLDLSGCTHDFGCAYCTWYRGPTSDMDADPVALVEGQLRRVAETNQGRLAGFVDILDIRVFRHLERFAEMAVALDLPPTTFCFEPRVDRALKMAPQLARALDILERKGHGIYLFRMGAENLVEEENAYFNKHVTFQQLVDGPARLAEIKTRHPDNFDYDPTWGFITCSPWTTLEMLRTNVDRAIEAGLEPLGVWLYTPLLLYGGAPITVLAQHDGLIVPEYEDVSLLYEPAVNGVAFSSLTPWRFRDTRTGTAMAFIVRFCAIALRDKYPDTIFERDERHALLLDKLGAETPLGRPDLFARELIAVLGSPEAPVEDAALLDAALARYAAALDALPQAEVEAEGRGVEASVSEEDRAIARRTHGFRRALETVLERLGPRWADVEVRDLSVARPTGAYVLDLMLEATPYRLVIADKSAEGFLHTTNFRVAHAPETPVRSAADHKRLARLLDVLDQALTRHAPTLLPGA